MRLSGRQYEQLLNALTDAYRTWYDLALLVQLGLDQNLDLIVGGRNSPLFHVAFDLLQWAAAHGKLQLLIVAALARNSGNAQLRAFAESVGLDYADLVVDVGARNAEENPPIGGTDSTMQAVPNLSNITPFDRSGLRRFLTNQFSELELKELTFDLAMRANAAEYATKSEFCMALITYCEQHSVLDLLLRLIMTYKSEAKPLFQAVLSSLPQSVPRKKVQVTLPQDTLDQQDQQRLLAAFAQLLDLPPEDIQLLGTAPGSTRLLLGLPPFAALRLLHSGITEVAGFKIEAVQDFDDLHERERENWRSRIIDSITVQHEDVIEREIRHFNASQPISRQLQDYSVGVPVITAITPTEGVFVYNSMNWNVPFQLIVHPDSKYRTITEIFVESVVKALLRIPQVAISSVLISIEQTRADVEIEFHRISLNKNMRKKLITAQIYADAMQAVTNSGFPSDIESMLLEHLKADLQKRISESFN